MTTSRSSAWLRLDPFKLNLPRPEAVKGLDAKVYLSPYDIPQAVRAFFDPKRKCKGVEFRYMDPDEPVSFVTVGKVGCLSVGKNSRRIFSVALPESDPRNQTYVAFAAALEDAINQFIQDEALNPTRQENYEIARRVIEETKAKLDQLQDPPSS
jgi:hypothetical protein